MALGNCPVGKPHGKNEAKMGYHMYSYWKTNLYVVLVVAFVGMASFTLVTPFLPYVLKSMDITENLATWSGFAYAASFLTSGLMAPVWGSVADKYGKRIQLLRSGMGIAVTYALYPLARTPIQFVILRGITGLMSGFMPATTSLVATNTPEEHMGYALGMLQAASAAGTISGPLLGGAMVSGLGIPFTFRLSAVVLIFITIASYALLKEEVIAGNQKINIIADVKECFANRDLVAVFVCLFLVQAAIQMTQPTLVLYVDEIAQQQGKNSTLISGTVYSVAGLGTVLGAALAARQGKSSLPNANTTTVNDTVTSSTCSSKIPQISGSKASPLMLRLKSIVRLNASPGQLFTIGLTGSALAIALQGTWVNLMAISGFRMAFGLFNGIVAVAGNVLAAQAVSRDFRGRAFGVLNGVLPLGSVTGPVIGGAMGDSLGLGSSFYASGAVFLLSAGVFKTFGKRKTVQPDQGNNR
ncbi:MAG TPA: multidrug efflux MFS transporter [Firmicutes bacterium]|nr:multidrug efflux MFS transporter [Candidatus Fermentithermobacillaceae bacterium]